MAAVPADEFEDIAARAARLGVTADRVLEEYAHIAFVDLRHIIEWDKDGVTVKPPDAISADDISAISDISPTGQAGKLRVKLYDKKAALDAIARHLGMFPAPLRRHEPAKDSAEAEDVREEILRRLSRLAAGGDTSEVDPKPEPERGGDL